MKRLTLNLWALLLFSLPLKNAWSGEKWLNLAIPGQVLISSKLDEKENPSSEWYALSLNNGALVLQQANQYVASDIFYAEGKHADRLLTGKPVHRAPKNAGYSVNASEDSLLLMRIQGGNREDAQQIKTGEFASSIAPDILREGWTATGELGGHQWTFSVNHKKRPDGKLLAGSLELIGESESANQPSKVILPPAYGMAFSKQELLWLGDINNDTEPDLLLRRTWITGEIDFVLSVSPLISTVYFDPDYPARYFSSGVEPDSNDFSWHKSQPMPKKINFISMGSFSIGQDEWIRRLSTGDQFIPKVFADKQFKLNGETIRFTLEDLPRMSGEGSSSSSDVPWGVGNVLVRATFRGKSQVLIQEGTPDEGTFSLSIGLIDGKPGVKIDDSPHYNNGFTRFWIYDETEGRFRKIQIEQSQGC